jgi:hypothetical protein
MTDAELSIYPVTRVTAAMLSAVPTAPRCFVCQAVIADGDTVLNVPADCDETENMQAGREYRCQYGHVECMRAIP